MGRGRNRFLKRVGGSRSPPRDGLRAARAPGGEARRGDTGWGGDEVVHSPGPGPRTGLGAGRAASVSAAAESKARRAAGGAMGRQCGAPGRGPGERGQRGEPGAAMGAGRAGPDCGPAPAARPPRPGPPSRTPPPPRPPGGPPGLRREARGAEPTRTHGPSPSARRACRSSSRPRPHPLCPDPRACTLRGSASSRCAGPGCFRGVCGDWEGSLASESAACGGDLALAESGRVPSDPLLHLLLGPNQRAGSTASSYQQIANRCSLLGSIAVT